MHFGILLARSNSLVLVVGMARRYVSCYSTPLLVTVGITSCVLMRYLEQFSFTFSSNIVVVIAVERLYTLHNPLMVSDTTVSMNLWSRPPTSRSRTYRS